MLQRLQKLIVLITMCITTVILLITLGTAYALCWHMQHSNTQKLLEYGLNLKLPQETQSQAIDHETSKDSSTQSFELLGRNQAILILEVTPDGDILSAQHAEQHETKNLQELTKEVLSNDTDAGFIPNCELEWRRELRGSHIRIVGAFVGMRDAGLRTQLMIDLGIFSAVLLVVYLIINRLSRRLVAPIQEAWERQHRFIADASHELKTPLAVLIANLQLLKRGSNPEQKRWLDSSIIEARFMRKMIEDLLQLARLDEERAQGEIGAHSNRELISLSELCEDSLLDVEAMAFEQGHELQESIDSSCMLWADPEELKRVVKILLDNAIKYAASESPICIKLKQISNMHVLTIHNEGKAIAAEDLPHLFERFYRSDTARTHQEGSGVGLGLAIAKSIIEQYHGTISVSSTNEAGTCFTVKLPASHSR